MLDEFRVGTQEQYFVHYDLNNIGVMLNTRGVRYLLHEYEEFHFMEDFTL